MCPFIADGRCFHEQGGPFFSLQAAAALRGTKEGVEPAASRHPPDPALLCANFVWGAQKSSGIGRAVTSNLWLASRVLGEPAAFRTDLQKKRGVIVQKKEFKVT